MLKEFQNEIKRLFIEENYNLTHITKIPPEEIQNGKLEPSKARANKYEIERGNYLFASSQSINNNPYIARDDYGMAVRGNICIYNNDVFRDNSDNEDKKLLLRKPSYIYELNVEPFVPVVALRLNKNRTPYFNFSKEWICNKSIDIYDKSLVRKITEVKDVTTLLKHYQIFTDTQRSGEADKILNSKTIEETRKSFFDSLKNKRLKYINGCYKTNVNPIFEINGKTEDNVR